MSHSQNETTESTTDETAKASRAWTPELFWTQVREVASAGKVIQDLYDDDFSAMEEAGLRDCFANTEANRSDCEELNKYCR